MEYVTGYFTIERNIVGATLPEMETRLGLRPGRLARGARVLVLLRQPLVGEFVFAGSTLYSDARGLVGVDRRKNVPVPHAWLGQRLVKVVPNLPHSETEWYPAAKSPVEQWQLLMPVQAEQVGEVTGQQAYWRR
jgi:hypothetical protein